MNTAPIRPEDVEFTETEYLHLLDLAASKYRFCNYAEEAGTPFLVWRHDIDYSPQRALALARIEAAKKLRLVYHVQVASRYYNVFEPEIADILKEIARLGHEIGLHFDMDVFGIDTKVSQDELLNRIAFEKHVLETVVEAPMESLSFHNYSVNIERLEKTDELCGMRNVCAARIIETFKYVSDSNGIWRYDRLADVLAGPPLPRLHVLTHPVWWTAEPMRPIERFRRAVEGRAQTNLDIYLTHMKRDGRHDAIATHIGLSDDESDPT